MRHVFHLPLSPLWREDRPRNKRSSGGPVISCLYASTAPPLWRAAQAGQRIIRRPSNYMPFVLFGHRYGVRPKRTSLTFSVLPNLPPLWRAALPRSERSVHIELAHRTFRNGRQGMRTITPRTLKTLQVFPNGVCTRISFFVTKTVREIRAFFLSTTKIQLKRVNHKLSRRTIDAPWTGRVPEASSGP